MRRRKRKKQSRFSYNPLLWLTGCILLVLALQAVPTAPSSLSEENTPVSDIPAGSLLTVHCIDVGQGDATLILCDGEAMLIDAGDNDQGTKIQYYLQKQGVEELKYVIGTHPDADHIGGLDVILYKFRCGTIIMPEEEKDTPTYRDVIDTMEEKGYTKTLPAVGDTYSLGGASFTILSPGASYEESNNNSVALLLTHGGNTFLFTGDAEEAAENDMLHCGIPLDADVYHVGHHGSSSSTSLAFLEAVSPSYGVISCGADNPYGHPHKETLEKLAELDVQILRTDEQGTVIITSDGSFLTIQEERYSLPSQQ